MRSFFARWHYVLVVALFGLSSLALSLSPLLSSSAKAASVYDDLIQTTDSLVLEGISGCTIPVSYEALLVDLIQNRPVWSQPGYDNYDGIFEGANATFDNATAMQIVQQGQDADNNRYIQVLATTDPDAYWQFGYISNPLSYRYFGLYTPNSGYDIALMTFTTNSTCTSLNMTYGFNVGTTGSTSDPASFLVFINTIQTTSRPIFGQSGNVIYPPDYEGEEPTVPPGDSLSPRIGFNTNTDNSINALWIGNSDFCIQTALGGCITPKLRWEVFGPDETTLLESKVTEIYTPFNYKFPGNDTYYFQVSFVHPGPPFALFDPSISLKSVRFTINANGTFVVGGTGVQECTAAGSIIDCGEPNPLEDCSTYGLDVGGYVSCSINNFGIWLRNTLIDLFIPSYSFFTNFQQQIGEFLNSKLGFIATAFTTIIYLFQTVLDNAYSSGCGIFPPGTFFGASLSINVCEFENINQTMFQTMQGLLIGTTAVALFFSGLRKYHEVVDKR